MEISTRFLIKVLKEEGKNSNNINRDHNLLVTSVHAVLLESGFICFDSFTQKNIDFLLPQELPSNPNSTVSLCYTLPDLLKSDDSNHLVIESVVLKFQNLEKFVNVYGSLSSRNDMDLYKLCLDKTCFVPSIDFLLMNHVSMDAKEDGSSSSSSKSRVFEFWEMAKEKLALPLLIDLTEKTGLPSPVCFISRLPTDIKLKILEILPGVDIGKLCCVSSDWKHLSSNNNHLWRQKFMEFSLTLPLPCSFPGRSKISHESYWHPLLEVFSSRFLSRVEMNSWEKKFAVCWKKKAEIKAMFRKINWRMKIDNRRRRGDYRIPVIRHIPLLPILFPVEETYDKPAPSSLYI